MIEGHNAPAAGGSLANFRDLAGLALEEGGVTPAGVLFRGESPYDGDTLPTALTACGAFAALDLRSLKEAAHSPFKWPDHADLTAHPLYDDARPDRLPDAPDLPYLYEQILDAASERIAAVLDLVVSTPRPMYVFCSAGKDRTGIVVAALLRAGGVGRDQVLKDYTKSEQNLDLLLMRWGRAGSPFHGKRLVDRTWLTTPSAAMELVLARLDDHPGGPAGWFIAHGASGRALQTWRTRLGA
jgi:protein-tyrosine phosphatase